ncbi:hypothetical protein [Oleiharenicola sp. Vm1]|uniref:hypothetical protein n=1 Tax=Oleiharenicola sp. Vm1 TaxID=3398393 RepID=UPI0039F5BB84
MRLLLAVLAGAGLALCASCHARAVAPWFSSAPPERPAAVASSRPAVGAGMPSGGAGAAR